MHTYPHVQLHEVDLPPHVLNDVHHLQRHVHDILGLLPRITFFNIIHSQHNIAITNGVHLVNGVLQTQLIELRHEVFQHVHNLFSLMCCRICCKPSDIREKKCGIR